jgi:hypothetical protein
MIAEYENARREYDVEGAEARVGGVTASVMAIRTSPADSDDKDGKGEMNLWLKFSDVPSFDPSRVDFSIVVDGEEIPMRVDGDLRAYRDEGGRTLTAEDWANDTSGSNSQDVDGELITWLEFDIDSLRWDEPGGSNEGDHRRSLFSFPFAFDPVKAHENAPSKWAGPA